MFTHREVSNKVHGLTHSENSRHLLVWSTTNARCVLSILYTVSVLILHCKDLSFSVIASCHVLISQNITHASGSKCHMCVKNLTAICNWGFLWKAQGTRGMGVSSRINEGTSIVKGLDNTGYLSIHEQGLALKFFFFCIRVPLVTESLESFSKDMSWMVLHSALHWHSSRKYLNQPQDWL